MAEQSSAPSMIRLSYADAVPLGQGRCFVVGNEEIAVFRQRDGKIFATPNRCPHRQGPLSEGLIGDGRVICPLHGHQFNLKTGVGSEPGETIQNFPIEEINGQLVMSHECETC